jgi:hypothetical protein
MESLGRWRWFFDLPGSPAIPALFIGAASLGYNGLGPLMTGRQMAGTAFAGWALLGVLAALVLWFVWFFFRILLLMAALALGVVWLLYAAAYSALHRKSRAAPTLF